MFSDEYASKLANKRWHAYLKEESQNNKTFGANNKYLDVIMIIIFSVIKFILHVVENIQIKRRYRVEKVCVE
jgi:hypothetical protein